MDCEAGWGRDAQGEGAQAKETEKTLTGCNLTMRFKATLKTLTLDPKWKAKTHAILQDTIKEAAVAWLSAAINSHPIPAWSGASLGTFRELASQVEFNFTIRATPQGLRKGLGAGAGQAASSAKFEGNIKKGVYYFEYQTNLPHLVYNEYHNANASPDPGLFSRLKYPGPYNFQAAGEAAALSQLASVRIPLPKLRVKKVIQVK